jgi:hypothetical protein
LPGMRVEVDQYFITADDFAIAAAGGQALG